MLLGTVATVQNFKKKKDKLATQNGTVDEWWKMLYEWCKNIVEKRAQMGKKKAMNGTYWTNQKHYSFYTFT